MNNFHRSIVPLRIAIVGAGNIHGPHLRGLQILGDKFGHVVGIFDLNEKKAGVVAQKFSIPKIYSNFDAVLADQSVDVVAILTPPSSHKDLTIRALNAGKHVVCEKPMAENLAQCYEMLGAAQQSAGRLFVVQNRIYTDAMQQTRLMIQHGEIGSVRLVQTAGIEGAELLSRMPSIRSDNFGVISTAGVHQTYVIPWLIGQTITSVKAHLGKSDETPIVADDGTATISLTYSGGAHHSMLCTFEAGDHLTEHRLEIVGTRGRLRARREGDQKGRHEILERLPKGETEWQRVPLEDSSVLGREFGRMWGDYLNAIATGTEPSLTAETAARSIYTVHKIYQDAARKGTPVNF